MRFGQLGRSFRESVIPGKKKPKFWLLGTLNGSRTISHVSCPKSLLSTGRDMGNLGVKTFELLISCQNNPQLFRHFT